MQEEVSGVNASTGAVTVSSLSGTVPAADYKKRAGGGVGIGRPFIF